MALQPTPVFLPGESHGKRSPVDYIVHRVAESDTTEVTKNACTGMEETAMNTVGENPAPRNLEVICIHISP